MDTMKDNKLIAEFMGVKPPLYMEYHTSWDWLMPVAKKCINPEDNTEGWDKLAVALTTCDIDEVYQAVVEFIKEHQSLDQQVYLSKYTCDSCGDRTESVCFDEDKDINECMDCM